MLVFKKSYLIIGYKWFGCGCELCFMILKLFLFMVINFVIYDEGRGEM